MVGLVAPCSPMLISQCGLHSAVNPAIHKHRHPQTTLAHGELLQCSSSGAVSALQAVGCVLAGPQRHTWESGLHADADQPKHERSPIPSTQKHEDVENIVF